MPRVNLFVPPNTNVEAQSLQAASQEIFDGFIDEAGAFRKRPGAALFSDTGANAPIDGLYYWDERSVLLAICGSTLYSIDSVGAATYIPCSTPFFPAPFKYNSRATFAPVKPGGVQKIVIANGTEMYLYDGTTMVQIIDIDAPSLVSHVGFVDQYILANSLSAGDESRFFFSNVNAPTEWSAADFIDVEARPDNLTVLDVGWREILLGGPRSVEFYANDGVSPFSRIDGASLNTGIGAPYTVKFFSNTWGFLDDRRRFVVLNGRTPEIISKPIDRSLQALTSVSDAISDVIEADGRHFYVTTFPTDNKTFAYDFQFGYWAQWGNWNPEFQRYDRYRGQNAVYHRAIGKWLIGDKLNGKIYAVGLDSYLDGSDPIRTSIKTAFIDFGSSARKRSNRLSFLVNAGDGEDAGNDAAAFSLQYRDTTLGQFGNSRPVSMGPRGSHFFYRELRRNGIYRSRQYEIVHADNSAFNLVSAEEEAELLGN